MKKAWSRKIKTLRPFTSNEERLRWDFVARFEIANFFMEIPKINRIFNNFILQKKWNFCKPLHIHRNRSSTNIDNGKCTFKNGLLFRVLLIIDKVKPPFWVANILYTTVNQTEHSAAKFVFNPEKYKLDSLCFFLPFFFCELRPNNIFFS